MNENERMSLERMFDERGTLLKVSVQQCLDPFGIIKMGRNLRNGKEDIEYFGSIDEKIDTMCMHTLRNNKETNSLRESLMKGIDISERKMKVVDAVIPLYSKSIREFEKFFYKEDQKYQNYIKKVEKAINDGCGIVRLLEEFGNQYYILIGGYSRLSLYREAYNALKKEGVNSCDDKVFKISLCNVSEEGFDNEKLTAKLSKKEDIDERCAYIDLIITGLIMKDNLISKNNYRFRQDREAYAVQASAMINYDIEFNGGSETFFESILKQENLINNTKLEKSKLLQGVLYEAIEKCNDYFDDSEMNLADTDYFGHDSNSAQFSSYAAKAAGTALGTSVPKAAGLNRAIFNNVLSMLGINAKDGSLKNPSAMRYYLEMAGSTKEESTESATFFGTDIRNGIADEIKKYQKKHPKKRFEIIELGSRKLQAVIAKSAKSNAKKVKKAEETKKAKKLKRNIIAKAMEAGLSDLEILSIKKELDLLYKEGVKAGRGVKNA